MISRVARALLSARRMHREVSFVVAAFALLCISSAACGTSNGADGSSGDGSSDAGADSSGAITDDGTCPAGCATPPGACFATRGSCLKGTCSYAFSEGASCDDGDPCTSGDTCTARACRGISDPTCRVSGSDGGGGGDGGGGDGGGGSCANVTCNRPPPSTCNGAVLTVPDNVGTCAAGACSYGSHTVTCTNGCADGVCTQNGWTSATSNTNVDLYGVWGSAPNSIWAVGRNGVAMYWNGSAWQSRGGGTFSDIVRVHGTSASNVFSLAQTGGNAFDVLRFDGTQWIKLTTIPAQYPGAADIFAIGDNDAFVYVSEGTSSLPGDLYRVTNGTATKLGTSTSNIGSGYIGLWVFSPTNVWVTGDAVAQWDGTKFTQVGTSPQSSGLLWALNPDFVFSGWTQTPSLWGANHQWTITNSGHYGVTTGFCGTSTTRVYASMAYGGGGVPEAGYVVRYDGVGWSTETIPANVVSLSAIWCAPSGEAVAVGNAGTILMGP
jgi:hypothetical protein